MLKLSISYISIKPNLVKLLDNQVKLRKQTTIVNLNPLPRNPGSAPDTSLHTIKKTHPIWQSAIFVKTKCTENGTPEMSLNTVKPGMGDHLCEVPKVVSQGRCSLKQAFKIKYFFHMYNLRGTFGKFVAWNALIKCYQNDNTLLETRI